VGCAEFWVWAQAALASTTANGKPKPANPNNIVTNFFTCSSLQNWSHFQRWAECVKVGDGSNETQIKPF
jgi:hypothetical protein